MSDEINCDTAFWRAPPLIPRGLDLQPFVMDGPTHTIAIIDVGGRASNGYSLPHDFDGHLAAG